ncbi:dual oxidase maturation factor 1-like isoform X2 [Babylonia areolata]
MAWFKAFRNEYGFTWYGDNRTPVTFDFPLVTVTYLCAVLGVATLISSLGIRGRERWATTLRASYGVGIASIILVCLVGHDWLVGQTEVKTYYLYRSDNYFRGSVGLRIALHGCNVTLEGYYTGVNGEGHVSYAESMEWRDYGREPETITPYLEKGLPHPVLTVLDFLSADGGGLRWGRNFHSAGYFACALLWTAFAFWIVSNVLLMSVVCYGAFMFFLTGVAMVLSCVVYHVCRPPHPLHVHFGDSVLTTSYGWCFWLMLASGIVTLVLGALLFVLDHMFHEKVSEFFILENLDEDDLPVNGMEPPHKPKGRAPSLSTPYQISSGRLDTFDKLQAPDSRRSSMPQQPRKGSIFLEPGRRTSDQSMRRGSLLQMGTVGGGITNKGFEQERPAMKNPVFQPTNIQEEGDERMTEVRVEIEGAGRTRPGNSGSSSPNRQPSPTTVRDRRENHLNEQRQRCVIGATGDIVTCTAVVIDPPSDDNKENNDDREEESDRRLERESEGMTREGSEEHKGHDFGSDSAIASGAPSPTCSEKNSTCGDCEDSGH